MRRPDLSLANKILICLSINVLALLVGGVWFVSQQSGGDGSISKAVTTARLQIFAVESKKLLELQPESEWTSVLDTLGRRHNVTLGLFGQFHQWIAGPMDQYPDVMLSQRAQPREPNPPPRQNNRSPPPPRRHDRPSPLQPSDQKANEEELPRPIEPEPQIADEEGPYRLDFLETEGGAVQWVAIKLPIKSTAGTGNPNYLVVKANQNESELFFQRWKWIAATTIAILGSIALWAPLMLSIGRRLKRLSAATDNMAEGLLATRIVEDGAHDDISKLSQSVNCMAERLEKHADSQKRFLSDVAHELSSPIARMQAAIGLLEANVQTNGSRHLEKLDDQLQHMGGLVNELLQFSKTSHEVQPKCKPVRLADTVKTAVDREIGDKQSIVNGVSTELMVLAVPALLERAIANVLRNSLRYAGANRPTEVTTTTKGNLVTLHIMDEGDGVLDEVLPHLFEAFYRPDPGRNANSGGTGLGLAIVKSCIETCGGRVSARNRDPRGFEVLLVLKQAYRDS